MLPAFPAPLLEAAENAVTEPPQTLHARLFLLAYDRCRGRLDGTDRWRFSRALRKPIGGRPAEQRPLTTMGRAISKARLGAGVAALVAVVGMYLLPFLLREDTYGEVPIPGSATVHLPAGEVDLTVRAAAWSHDELSVPPLSIQISGPDGSLQPEAAAIRRTKYFTSEDTWVRLWVLNVEQEGDYHIEVDGEVYGVWQPWLTFHHMGNGVVDLLILIGAIASSVVFSVAIVIGVVALAATLGGLCVGACARKAP